jgi:peptidyl-prolyl cis-trans isomerase C
MISSLRFKALCFTLLIATVIAKLSPEEINEQARIAAKPWYLRNTQAFGYTLPFTPVTLLIFWCTFYSLIRSLLAGAATPTAEACHILLLDSSDHSRTKLEALKSKIGANLAEFQTQARKHSGCPSKNKGGSLGSFKQGAMAPAFDKAVFDPKSSVGTTIGPVQTQFGWHLIFITKRQ